MSTAGNDLPRRKANRLGQYDYDQAGCYFITLCTRDRQRILSHIVGDDAHIVPTPIGQVLEKYIRSAPEVETYVIMPDHVHLMIRLENGPMWASAPTEHRPRHNRIASIVRSIKVLTSKEIGLSIFQRSYYDHIIRNEQDYTEVWEYIRDNPAKWQVQHREK